MVRVDENGNRVDGADKPVNAAGFMIHSAIHQRRPDIHAACHMHSPYGRAWSTFGKPIDMMNQGNDLFGWVFDIGADKFSLKTPACSTMTSLYTQRLEALYLLKKRANEFPTILVLKIRIW